MCTLRPMVRKKKRKQNAIHPVAPIETKKKKADAEISISLKHHSIILYRALQDA